MSCVFFGDGFGGFFWKCLVFAGVFLERFFVWVFRRGSFWHRSRSQDGLEQIQFHSNPFEWKRSTGEAKTEGGSF